MLEEVERLRRPTAWDRILADDDQPVRLPPVPITFCFRTGEINACMDHVLLCVPDGEPVLQDVCAKCERPILHGTPAILHGLLEGLEMRLTAKAGKVGFEAVAAVRG